MEGITVLYENTNVQSFVNHCLPKIFLKTQFLLRPVWYSQIKKPQKVQGQPREISNQLSLVHLSSTIEVVNNEKEKRRMIGSYNGFDTIYFIITIIVIKVIKYTVWWNFIKLFLKQINL